MPGDHRSSAMLASDLRILPDKFFLTNYCRIRRCTATRVAGETGGNFMKLRIAGSSLRLRVSPSDLARLMESGRIEETIRFAADADAHFTFALEQSEAQSDISIRSQPQGVIVVLPAVAAREWAEGEGVGIYGSVDAAGQKLELRVEKDFACLDGSDRDNLDTFPNPQKEGAC
jgi:hypothetical protein